MRLLLLSIALLFNGGPDIKPAASTAVPSVKVAVREASDVPGGEFTLGEISEITGTDKALAAQIATVRVGSSPLAGLTRSLEQFDILVKLRANRIDTRSIDLKCPVKVRITRAGAEVPAQEIAQAAIGKLTEERKNIGDGATLEALPLIGRWFVTPGKRDYKAVVSRGSVESGPVIINVTALVEGNPVKSVDVTIKIKRMITALRMKRPVSPHTVLTADDVTVGTAELIPGSPLPVADLQAVIGKRTTRQLAMGDLLSESSVELAPVVQAGQQVTMELIVGGIHLNTAAVTRQAGALGQAIRVYATDTHKEFTAIVVDGKTVRVEDN